MYNRYVPTSGKNAIKGFESHLPIKSWGVYYKDEIGNISTSNAYRGVIFTNFISLGLLELEVGDS